MSAFAVSVLVKATIVLAMALGCARAARDSRAAVRHLVLAAAFAVLLVLPLASLLAPSVRVALPIAASAGLIEPPPDAVPGVTAIGPSSAADSGAPPAHPWQPPGGAVLAAAAWLLGVGICLLPVAAGLWQMRKLRHSALPWREAQTLVAGLAREAGIRRDVDVLVSDAVRGPMTCGVLPPAIVLPSDAQAWPEGDLERAIVHELEHVRRADWLTQSLARIVCGIYWMHPLVWIARRQLALEAERVCDDAVLRRRSNARDADPAVYADQLVGLARRLSATDHSPLLAMAARHDLTARVAALLDAGQRRGPAGTRWVVLAVATAALLVAAISPLRIIAAATPQPPANASSAAPAGHFDAATIKPCKAEDAPPGPARGGMGGTNASFSPGRMNVPCVTLEQLIYLAYAGSGAWPDHQLVNVVPGSASDSTKVRGGPAWVHSQHDKFAVEATAAGASQRNVLLGDMLRTLLEERFHLQVHRDTEDVAMYALKVAPGGLKLKPMQTGDCEEYQPGERVNQNAAKPTCGSLLMLGHGPNTVWTWGGAKLESLAHRLSGPLGRYVIDQTGVTDEFIIRLEFHPDENTPGIRPAEDRDADTSAPQAASIFTALEQQIGVKVDKTRGPRGFLVIDHVEPLAPHGGQ